MEARKVTIYRGGGFGYTRVEARAYEVTIGKHAQYPAAATVRYLEPRKRTPSGFVETSHPRAVILDGWGHPDVRSPLDDTTEPGSSLRTASSRYSSFSPEYDREFNEFIAPIIAAGAKVLHDFRDHNASVPQKIVATEVRLTWSESIVRHAIDVPLSWTGANKAIRDIAASAPEGGAYNKTGYTVTWADGEKYEGRIDVTRAMAVQRRPLTEWIRNFNFNLSERGGARFAEIRAAAERHQPGAIAAADDLLDRRDIGE